MASLLEFISLTNLFDLFSSGSILADTAADPSAIRWYIDFILHLDDKLKELLRDYGIWTHLILFLVIFCETGLVVTPFLPGDSLLFAAGAFAADRSLRIEWLIPLFIIAAILGDTVNYWIGRWLGERIFTGKIPFLTKANLDKTHSYFERYGGMTIILARFVPIVRTFAPFVAGVGSMNYRRFITYNVVGGVVWVVPIVALGYWVGGWEIVQKNFELVVLGIVGLSILPMFIEAYLEWRHRRAATR